MAVIPHGFASIPVVFKFVCTSMSTAQQTSRMNNLLCIHTQCISCTRQSASRYRPHRMVTFSQGLIGQLALECSPSLVSVTMSVDLDVEGLLRHVVGTVIQIIVFMEENIISYNVNKVSTNHTLLRCTYRLLAENN